MHGLWEAATAGDGGGAASDGAAATARGCSRTPPHLPDGARTGSVFKDAAGKWRFEEGLHEGAVARAAFLDAARTPSNFGKLRVASEPSAPDADQAFAAGFAEGWLTAERIADHHENLKVYFERTLNASLGRPMAFVRRQDAWVRRRAAAAAGMPQLLSEADGGWPGGGGGDGGEAAADLEDDAAAAAAAAAAAGCGAPGSNCGGGGGGGGDRAYWTAVALMLRQWDGLVAGYEARAAAAAAAGGAEADAVGRLSRADLLFLHSNGDLYDLIDKYDAEDDDAAAAAQEAEAMEAEVMQAETAAEAERQRQQQQQQQPQGLRQRRHRRRVSPRSSRAGRKRYAEMGAGELYQAIALAGKCSALIKVTEDLSEIFFGHSTWDSYTAMTRVFKHYELNFGFKGAAARRLSFSSYPGAP